jgi:APA family basic amino acid/polyamine antiporter
MVLVLFAVNVAGLREGRALQVSTTILKATMLVLFVVATLWLLSPSPEPSHAEVAPVGFLALAGAYQLIRGAYNGWHAPVYFSEENVRPSRNITRSLFAGILFTGALYVVINATLLYALGPSHMGSGSLPYLTVLNRIAGGWTSLLFAAGAMMVAASCANANVMITPRILLALSRDRLLPASLQSINRGGSPYIAFVVSALAGSALTMAGGFRFVFGMIGTLVTLASLITEIAYFVLRTREPDLARPWRALLHPWLPAAAIVIDGVLLVLFVMTDIKAALVAAALCALSIPAALLARRFREHAS